MLSLGFVHGSVDRTLAETIVYPVVGIALARDNGGISAAHGGQFFRDSSKVSRRGRWHSTSRNQNGRRTLVASPTMFMSTPINNISPSFN